MRVALLQNFVAPYRVPLYERLQERLDQLRVFVSVPMEDDRDWKVDWGTLDVVVQRNLTIRRVHRDAMGFARTIQIHFPYDTLTQLWRYRPDAVISVELGFRTLQSVLYKILRPRTRLFIWCKLSEHSERGWGVVRRVLRRIMLRRADGVLVNGESGARYIATFGVADARIHRINQPVDVAMFAQAKRVRPAAAKTRLLCSGSLISRKGVVPFLRQLGAWAIAHPETSLELLWVGDGPLREELAGMPGPPNLLQTFVGSVAYGDLPYWYSQADLLVLPSLLDEWGLVVNEAMAAGLPVIGSIYAQAVMELVTDGVTGWRFDPVNPESLGSVLDRMTAASEGEMEAMRVAARRRIATLTPDTAAMAIHRALQDGSLPEWGRGQKSLPRFLRRRRVA